MRNQVLYASAIFALSALLIGSTMFAVDAKTFDEEQSYSIKGKEVRVNGDNFDFTLSLNRDGETAFLFFVVNSGNGGIGAVCPTISDKIINIQGLGKASIEFGIDDLGNDCIYPNGKPTSLDVSFEIKTDGKAITEKLDGTHECYSGFCSSEVGTSVGKVGIATGTISGEEIDEDDSRISNVNYKYTFWTEP